MKNVHNGKLKKVIELYGKYDFQLYRCVCAVSQREIWPEVLF